jgi:hypothetical protein
MKRMIISGCLVAIAAGLVAAPASAAVRHFHGPVTGGGSVDFDVTFKNGKPKTATNFGFNVHVHCSDGASGLHGFSYTGIRPVVDRKFSYTFQTFKARFNGTIKATGHKAFGSVSYGPNSISGHPGCTTGGAKSWTASG